MHKPIQRTVTALAATLSWSVADAGELQDLIAQFSSINTLKVVADVQVMMEPAALDSTVGCATNGVGIPGEGDFTFLVSGPLWRTSSNVDPDVIPGLHSEAAWNGQVFQCFDRSTGVLGLFDQLPPAQEWPSLQNPLFSLVEFLDPVTDATAGRILLLQDVQQQAAAANLASIVWTQDPVARSLVYADFPGASVDGFAYTIRVVAPASDRSNPARIDLRSPSGAVLARTAFSGWQPADNTPAAAQDWPRVYVFEVFDPPTGVLVSRLSMTITELRINDTPPPAADFLIPWSQATHMFINNPAAMFSP